MFNVWRSTVSGDHLVAEVLGMETFMVFYFLKQFVHTNHIFCIQSEFVQGRVKGKP